MELIGQFVVFCVPLAFGVFIGRILIYFSKYSIARSLIEKQFRQVLLVGEHISAHDHVSFDQKTNEIVEQIIIQMCRGIKYQRNWMIRHAIDNKAILYRTTVWLANDPDDMDLYAALDVVKQKFYYMHGTFPNIKKNELRNHINMQMYTSSGDHLTGAEDVAEYNKKEQGAGCRIKITMSIVTSMTSKKYDYEKYI